jgi:uncharacterized repeat protein (TIGR02543 family)
MDMRKIVSMMFFMVMLFSLAACTGTEQITITFNSNGGSEIEDLVIDADTADLNLPEPTREGYIFDGWFFDEDLTNPFAIAGLLTNQNPTLYAKWTEEDEDTVTVTFESNGGSSVPAIVGTSGDALSEPADPTKAGFTFDGWYSDEALTTPYTFSTIPDNDVTLYAKWEAIIVTYTITFNSNGGSSVTAIELEAGAAIPTLPTPTKADYNFDGWYSDEALTTAFTTTTMPENDFTLYAKWTPKTYQMIFNTNGGSAVTTIEAPYLSTITAPTNPTKKGYTFQSWHTDEALTSEPYVFGTMPSNGITLYAKWSPIVYTITFDTDGGTTIDPIELGYELDIPDVTAPTKVGYTFAGWYSDETLTTAYTITTMPLNGITLYAKWDAALVNVDIEIYTETLTGTFELKETLNETAYTASTYTHTPGVVSGFTFDADHTLNDLDTFVNADGTSKVTVYYTRKEITITYDSNEGSAVIPTSGLFEETIILPIDPQKLGYTFVDWYKDEALTQVNDITAYPDSDITLYAKWDAAESTIKFDTKGGDELEDLVELTGDAITLPIPTKAGYEFLGWYKDDQLTISFDDTTMPAGMTLVYAKWQVKTYSITYDSVGGSLVTSESHPFMTPIVEPAEPTKTDYIFNGWYLDNTYTMPFVFDTMPDVDLTLYAKWIDATNPNSLIVKLDQPAGTIITVSGIVYGENDQTIVGFYIYDDTGYVYVMGDHTGINLNDMVTLTGELDFDGEIPYIKNLTSITVDSTGNTPKVALNLPFEDVEKLEFVSPAYIHNLYQFEGILFNEGGQYALLDTQTLEGMALYGPSYNTTRTAELDALVLERVQMTFVLVFDNGAYELSLVSIVANPYTELEKIALIEYLFTTYGFEDEYMEETKFMIPDADPLGFTHVTYQAVGDNAIYYDQTTQMFLDVEVSTVIDFEVTFTSQADPLVSHTMTISITVIPLYTQTVVELLTGIEGATYTLDVIVVSTTEMGYAILKDDTGSVFAYNDDNLQIGDRVIVTVKRRLEGNVVVLSKENMGFEILDIVSHENELDLVPTSMTIEEVNNLDLTDPTIYGQYIEVRGYLLESFMGYHGSRLVDGTFEMMIESSTYSGFEKLMQYGYLEVYIKGYIGMSHESMVLLYEGIREDVRIPEYTDQELVDTIKQSALYQFENLEFYAFDSFPLYPYHPELGASITWDLSQDMIDHYNMENQSFTYSLVDVPISMTATITKGDATAVLTLTSTLHAIEITPLADIPGEYMYGTYFIQGIISYWHPMYSYITDGLGNEFLIAETLHGVRKGDEVLLYASLGTYNNTLRFVSNYGTENFVLDIINTDQTVTYDYQTYDMETLVNLNSKDYSIFNQWIEVEGHLVEAYGGYAMILETVYGQVSIECPDQLTEDELMLYEGQMVTLRAILHTHDYYDGFVLRYLGFEGDVVVSSYSDLGMLNATKAYILDVYQQPVEEQSYFDFNEAYRLFKDGTFTINPLDDTFGVLDIIYDYIGPVDSDQTFNVEVTIEFGLETETFNITMTVLNNEASSVTVSTIADMMTDPANAYTIRGLVVGVVETTDNSHILMLEDATGIIYLTLDYDVYYQVYDYGQYGLIGDTFEVHGKAVVTQNRYEIDYSMIAPYSRNETVAYVFTPEAIADLLALDLMDSTIYGTPVNVTGIVEKIDINQTTAYVINDGTHQIMISMTDAYWPVLSNYVGYQVTIDGFVFGVNSLFDETSLTIMLNDYSYDGALSIQLDSYSDDEIVMMALNQVVMQFDSYNPIRMPFEWVSLPSLNQIFTKGYPSMSFVYYVVNGGDYIEFYGNDFSTKLAAEDQIIEFRVEVSYNGITKEAILKVNLNGFTPVTLADLFAVEEGTNEIVLEAEVLMSGFGYYYLLIEDQVYYLETYGYSYVNTGDQILLVGQKSLISGKADYTYNIYLLTTGYAGSAITYTPVTINDLYMNDYDLNPIDEEPLMISGKLGFDPYLEMFTLTDNGKMIYLRLAGWSGGEDLFDYMDAYIAIGGFMSTALVRDEFIVFDTFGTNDVFDLIVLTGQESVDEIKLLIDQYLGDLHLKSGMMIEDELPLGDPFYHTTISYELVDPLDEAYVDLDHMLLNIVDVETVVDILVTITSLDGLGTAQTTISLTIHPRTDMTIKETLRAMEETYVQTVGVITEIVYDGTDIYYFIIDDGTHATKVYISSWATFGYDDLDLSIGDEVRVIGSTLYEDDMGVVSYIDLGVVVDELQSGQTLVKTPIVVDFLDIMNLEYLDEDYAYLYVEITGTLYSDGYTYYIESDEYYVDGYYGNQYYNIEIVPSDYDAFNTELNAEVGNEITIEGYLWLESLSYMFQWYITDGAHQVVVSS